MGEEEKKNIQLWMKLRILKQISKALLGQEIDHLRIMHY